MSLVNWYYFILCHSKLVLLLLGQPNLTFPIFDSLPRSFLIGRDRPQWDLFEEGSGKYSLIVCSSGFVNDVPEHHWILSDWTFGRLIRCSLGGNLHWPYSMQLSRGQSRVLLGSKLIWRSPMLSQGWAHIDYTAVSHRWCGAIGAYGPFWSTSVDSDRALSRAHHCLRLVCDRINPKNSHPAPLILGNNRRL